MARRLCWNNDDQLVGRLPALRGKRLSQHAAEFLRGPSVVPQQKHRALLSMQFGPQVEICVGWGARRLGALAPRPRFHEVRVAVHREHVKFIAPTGRATA